MNGVGVALFGLWLAQALLGFMPCPAAKLLGLHVLSGQPFLSIEIKKFDTSPLSTRSAKTALEKP